MADIEKPEHCTKHEVLKILTDLHKEADDKSRRPLWDGEPASQVDMARQEGMAIAYALAIDLVGRMVARRRGRYIPGGDNGPVNGQTVPQPGSGVALVYEVIKDHKWHSLEKISSTTGRPAASVSADLRRLRTKEYGGHVVERRHAGFGHTYEYRLGGEEKHGESPGSAQGGRKK